MAASVGVRILARAGEPGAATAARPDRGELAALYRANVDSVFGFCHRRLGTREAAEDATTEAFVKALAAYPRFRGGSTKGLLFAIASRIVVDQYRETRSDVPLGRVGDRVDPAPGLDHVVIRDEPLRSVRALVEELPDERRRIVELRLAGLTGAEIAEAIGRSHGAVRSLRHPAVTTLPRRRCRPCSAPPTRPRRRPCSRASRKRNPCRWNTCRRCRTAGSASRRPSPSGGGRSVARPPGGSRGVLRYAGYDDLTVSATPVP